MEIPVSYPGFEGQNLTVKTAGMIKGAHLLLNGVAVKKEKGAYSVKNNAGGDVLIKLRGNPLDPTPKVVIGKDVIQLARPLTWYEYSWMALPIALVFLGGALGGGIGAFAAYTNGKIFRSYTGAWAKYGLTALVSIAAVAAYVAVAAVFVQLLEA
jgi:hypothetical protein